MRAVEGHRAAPHDRDVVADLLDLVHVVRAEQHGQPAVGEPLDQRPHVADAAGVQAVGRLVEHQQPRVAQQAGRDAEALAHAVGVAAHLVAGAVAELDDVEHLVDPVVAGAGVEEGEAVEVLPTGEVGVEARALDEARHPVEGGDAVLGPRAPEDAQGARRRAG